MASIVTFLSHSRVRAHGTHKKRNTAGLMYGIAVSLENSQIVWTYGTVVLPTD